MKKLLCAVLVVAFGLGTVGLVMAADAPKKDGAKKEKPAPEVVFKKKDKNQDGKLTLEEFAGKAKDQEKAEKRFKSLDKDGDGALTVEEFSAPPAKKGGKKKPK